MSTEGKPKLRVMALLATLALSLFGLSFQATTPAQAVPVTGFNPGNIISDDLFYEGRALSANEIQTFLNAQVSRCLIGSTYAPGSKTPGGNTVASACLKDFRMTTQSVPADAYCSAYVGQPNETAAQIIAKVGLACGISPKVLLVMLEKEQSLVTDDWPTTRMYNYAMGWGCPDSGPGNTANCDANGAGFAYQVYKSAWQFKVYKANPDSPNFRSYRPHQYATIKWNPNSECGTSSVYIENSATAALYIYTPYRPNQAALDAGWGTGDACSSYGNRNFFLFYNLWFGSPQLPSGTPVGELKGIWATSNQINLWGWAVDLDDPTKPLQIHVKYGSSWAAATANSENGTAEALYPGAGPNHGFGMRITAPAGTQRVCVYAKNIGSGDDRLLGCEQLNVPDGAPVGTLGDLWQSPGTINLWGWALDPDTSGPIDIHISINNRWAVLKADAENSAAASLYPDYGMNHGFGGRIPADPGSNRVCVYAINQGPGSNTLLGCRVVNVPTGNPVGQVKEIWGSPGAVSMWGWALDPDTTEPIDLHVLINGRWAVVNANAESSSTLAAFPGHGTNHAFGAVIPADPGLNRVCVYAINKGPGVNTTLLCKDVTVPNGDPRGEVKEIWGRPGYVSMWGWAADPDTADPIDLHVRVDGNQWFVVPANAPYSSMPQLMPGLGLNHGFGANLPLSPGSHEVCVFAANVGPGSSKLLTCAVVSS